MNGKALDAAGCWMDVGGAYTWDLTQTGNCLPWVRGRV